MIYIQHLYKITTTADLLSGSHTCTFCLLKKVVHNKEKENLIPLLQSKHITITVLAMHIMLQCTHD